MARQAIPVRQRPDNDGDRTPLLKWRQVKPGTEIVGTYRGMRQGKFGPLADLETEQGAVTVPVPTALLTDLSRVRKGGEVSITYNGKQENQRTGRTFHSFDVNVFDEADLLPEGTEPAVTPARGYERQIRGGDATSARPIRQAAPAAEDTEAQAPAPAAKPAGKGRSLKSVFQGLD